MPVEAHLISLRQKRRRSHMARAPLWSSAGSPWHGIRVEQYGGGPCEIRDEAPLNHHLLIQLNHPTTFEFSRSGGSGTIQISPGQTAFYPALQPFTAMNADTGEFLCLVLDPGMVVRAAQEVVQPDRLNFLLRPVVDDPLVRGVGLALRAEGAAGYPGGRWYGDSLVNLLAVHLVRHYAEEAPQVRPNEGGLARTQLRRALEFIHEHLTEEVSLTAVATAAGLSPFHFARLFKRSTGLTPHQYLIHRRLDRARELLRTTATSMAEVALASGFYDQSHMATHFRRVYKLTPGEYRRG